MKTSEKTAPVKTWEKTSQQNLVRHKSGRYYARTFGNNKEIWKSLRTTHFSVAKARLDPVIRGFPAGKKARWLGQRRLTGLARSQRWLELA